MTMQGMRTGRLPLRRINFLGFLAVLALAAPAMAAESCAGDGCANQKVVGGGDADSQGAEGVVALVASGFTASSGQYCGASLITPRWVLTAAHCVTDRSGVPIAPSSLQAIIGAENLNNTTGSQRANIERIVVHPNWTGTASAGSDVALVRIDQEASEPTVDLASNALMNSLRESEPVFVFGWGYTTEGDSSSRSAQLQTTMLPHVSNAACNNSYPGGVDSDMTCAGFAEGQRDSCQGDSGGPLFAMRGGKRHLIGVVSWGDGCAKPYRPGVYARVSVFNSWIQTVIDGARFNNAAQLGYVGVGESAAQTMQFVNGTATAITVQLTRVTGVAASDFSISNDGCNGTAVNAGQSCQLQLNYNGTSATGRREAQLELLYQVGSGVGANTWVYAPVRATALGRLAGTAPAGVTLYSGDDAVWAHSAGSYSSGNIGDSGRTVLLAYSRGISQLAFDWGVSSQQRFDWLSVQLNDQYLGVLSGSVASHAAGVSLPSGTSRLQWTYHKDHAVSSDSDSGSVANLREGSAPSPRSGSLGAATGGSGGGGGGSPATLWFVLIALAGVRRFLRA